ncbi:Flp family type IVb pilin [Sphingobium sp. DC-2]|uniref:Flp family type IVb pilin n=1 Tax=Sphingobium sp. DC-2 TaxID=1303256 RepID=UPI0004C3A9AB|nr:Flp family type IVb pilin [Sphingobium sp. DC-2]
MSRLIGNLSPMALLRCERGATAIEYGLILALIALAIISSITSVANKTINMWNNVAMEVVNN